MSEEARYRRPRSKQYGVVSQSLLAHAGSIRDAISLPGAVPRPGVRTEQRAASLRHAYSVAAEQSSSSAVVACDQDMVKYFCMFCTPCGPVPGVLTLTPSVIMFEPDPRSAAVLSRGAGQFQLYVDILDVVACASVMLPDAPLLTCFFGFRHSLKSQPSFFQLVVDTSSRRFNKSTKRSSIRCSRRRSGDSILIDSIDSTESVPLPPAPPGPPSESVDPPSHSVDPPSHSADPPSHSADPPSHSADPPSHSAHPAHSEPGELAGLPNPPATTTASTSAPVEDQQLPPTSQSSPGPKAHKYEPDQTQQSEGEPMFLNTPSSTDDSSKAAAAVAANNFRQKSLVLPANAIVNTTTPKSSTSEALVFNARNNGLYTPVERSPGSYSRAQRLLGTLSSWGRSRRASGELLQSPHNNSSPKHEQQQYEDSGWFSRTFSRQQPTQVRPSTVQPAVGLIEKHERLLFRFASIEDVRELTTRTIEYLDQRDARLEEIKQQNEVTVDKKLSSCSEVVRHPSPPPLAAARRRFSATAGPSRTVGGVSFIGTNSGAVLDAFMLSPRAQHVALLAAQQRLLAESGTASSLANSLLLFTKALDQLQRGDVIGSSASVDSLRMVSSSSPKSSRGTTSSSQPALVGGSTENEISPATPHKNLSYSGWGVNVIPVAPGAPQLITPHVAQELSLSIAPSVSAKNWILRYCSATHGISYLTFFRRVKDIGPCILIIEDSRGALFGAFLSTSPVEKSHYYGSGETFVFTFWNGRSQTDESTPRTPAALAESSPVAVYTWTSRNNFLIYTDGRSIAVGGGGSYAITVDSSFLCGSSQPCSTFGNPVLSSTPDFLVRHLQVWGFSDDDS